MGAADSEAQAVTKVEKFIMRLEGYNFKKGEHNTWFNEVGKETYKVIKVEVK